MEPARHLFFRDQPHPPCRPLRLGQDGPFLRRNETFLLLQVHFAQAGQPQGGLLPEPGRLFPARRRIASSFRFPSLRRAASSSAVPTAVSVTWSGS